MILVADSGSTKAHWNLVADDGSISHFETMGFNPLFMDTNAIIAELERDFISKVPAEKITNVFFYGASCSSNERKAVVANALKHVFKQSEVMVDHDMLAAARALCGNKPGFAAILGTGANTCYYDGNYIVENIPALGFILGDEGSGAYIGRMIVREFIYKTLPAELSQKFYQTYQLTKDDIFAAVYSKPLPNRFLAQFATFATRNIEHPYIIAILEKAFDDFFTNHICRYDKHTEFPVGFVGSVAYYHSDILKRVATKYNVTVGTIVKEPISELTQYHVGLLKSSPSI